MSSIRHGLCWRIPHSDCQLLRNAPWYCNKTDRCSKSWVPNTTSLPPASEAVIDEVDRKIEAWQTERLVDSWQCYDESGERKQSASLNHHRNEKSRDLTTPDQACTKQNVDISASFSSYSSFSSSSFCSSSSFSSPICSSPLPLPSPLFLSPPSPPPHKANVIALTMNNSLLLNQRTLHTYTHIFTQIHML